MYEKELVELSRAGARYLVIGGIALAFYDFPRATFDLDIMPDLSSENLAIMTKVLKSLGYRPRVPVEPEALLAPQKREYWHKEKNMEVFTFIHLKNPLNLVDIMIYAPLDFKECFERKVTVYIKGTEIYVASVEDMLALKKISSRPQDLRDISALETILRKRDK